MSDPLPCKHCGDTVPPWDCESCEAKVADQCRCCHDEVAHGKIRIQNIHVCSSRESKANWDDYDANRKAR